MSALAIVPARQVPAEKLAELAVRSLPSASSRRNYSREIRRFLNERHLLTRDGVQAYLASRRDVGAGPVTLNVALAALKKFAAEANARGMLSETDYGAIERLKSVPIRGQKAGNWLTLDQVRELLTVAQEGKNGLRNSALLAVLLGCGLRRAEVAGLEWTQYQQRDGRPVFVDISGKGQRARTVAVPRWVASYLDLWRSERASKLLRPRKHLIFEASAQTVFTAVVDVATRAGFPRIRPHDLRRTAAKCMREGGASLESVQRVLGHSSVRTTEIYLEKTQDLREGHAAGDFIKLEGV